MTIRRLCYHFDVCNRSSRHTVENLIKKFERAFSLKDDRNLTHHCNKRSAEDITTWMLVSQNNQSPPCGISPRSWSSPAVFFTKDLHFHAYKIHLTHELQPTDHIHNWILEQLQVDDAVHNNIIFSDQVHFDINASSTSKILGSERRRSTCLARISDSSSKSDCLVCHMGSKDDRTWKWWRWLHDYQWRSPPWQSLLSRIGWNAFYSFI